MTGEKLQKLAGVITDLRTKMRRIRKHGTAIGEQDTKRVFITPLLGALGWDIQDLDEIRNEYRHQRQDNPVDYALFFLRSPCLFIEAKALNVALTDRKWISQIIGYAATAGVEWCVLTNGDEYRLYNAHAPVDADGKLFRTVRLSDETAESLTIETLDLLSKDKMGEKRLNVFWKAHFVDRRVKETFEGLIANQDPSLVRLLHKKITGLTQGDIFNSLKRADLTIEFPITSTSTDDLQEESSDEPPQSTSNDSLEKKAKPLRSRKRPQHHACSLKDLIRARLINPPFAIEATWRKQHFTATIQQDGSVIFEGQSYRSLSVAGGMARNIASGPPQDGRPYYQTNGWTFWKYQDNETGKLEVIDQLRQRYLATKKL